MKKSFSGFISGVIFTLLIGTLTVSALAISGKMTIEVDPINIQVNGETFAPTDVNGNPVPVFAYNGTTMAPLRALAEAYGLEVGYDAATNMATVVDPDAKATATTQAEQKSLVPDDFSDYETFKSMWEIVKYSDTTYSAVLYPELEIELDTNLASREKFKHNWNELSKDIRHSLMQRLHDEIEKENGCNYLGFIVLGTGVGGTLPGGGYVEVNDID